MPENATSGNAPGVESPYASAAYALLERDLPAIPSMAGAKIPGIYSEGRWRPMHGWTRFADRMPTDAEVEEWASWPGAGIALPLGGVSRTMGVDFDVEGAPLAALEGALEGLLACRKRGRKGYTAFMQVGNAPWGGKCELQSRFDITLPDAPTDRQRGGLVPTRAVDILAYGKQTIMPPSIHPEGMAYGWLTDLRLDDCDVRDLPTCPSNLIGLIARALEPWTTDRNRAQHAVRAHVKTAVEGDSWCRDMNDRALSNLGMWVPDLIVEKFLQRNGEGYRAVPYWRGVFDAHKVSISPAGIKDFASNQGYTPIDLVMAVRCVSLSDAIDWLAQAIQMPTDSVVSDGFFAALRSWGPAAAPVQQKHIEALPVRSPVAPEPAATPAIETTPAVAEPSEIAKAIGGLPSFITDPPGVLGEIARYITASAFRAQPQLSLAAAISFCATMMGQIYRGPTRSRTNLYLLAVAKSGAGKDHPLKCVSRLLFACGMGDFIGGAAMASGTAVQSRLAFQANTAYTIDEMGQLLSRLNSDAAGGHEREVLDVLMQAYSSADSPAFKGKDYADRSARSTTVARYPCLNIFGVTTPDILYESLGSADIVSGFLNRWMLVESDSLPEPQFDATDPNDVPEGITEWGTLIRSPRPIEGQAPTRGTPEGPILIPYANDAVRRTSHRFQLETDARYREIAKGGSGAEAMLARLPEQIGKLAMLAAAAIDPTRPVITAEAWEWAADYGLHYNAKLLEAAMERVAGSRFEAKVKRCLAALATRKQSGLTVRDMGRIGRAWRALERRERDQVVERLIESEMAMWITHLDGRKALVAAQYVNSRSGDDGAQ